MWGSIILLGVIAGAVVGALELGPGALFAVAVFGVVAIVLHDYRVTRAAIATGPIRRPVRAQTYRDGHGREYVLHGDTGCPECFGTGVERDAEGGAERCCVCKGRRYL